LCGGLGRTPVELPESAWRGIFDGGCFEVPSLRSGFRLRAQTPADLLNFRLPLSHAAPAGALKMSVGKSMVGTEKIRGDALQETAKNADSGISFPALSPIQDDGLLRRDFAAQLSAGTSNIDPRLSALTSHLRAVADVSRKSVTADTNSAVFSALGICPHLSNATKRAPGMPAAYFSPEEKGTS
jgi:hypothetical protein